MKKRVIIGIHGLGNKPPQLLLEEWWRLAIQEGLLRIKCPREINNFELAYWADVLHPHLQDIHETDDDAEDFMDERYIPASENEPLENHSFKTTMLQSIKDQLNNILFNEKLHVYFPSVTDFGIKHFFQELSVYFTKNCMDSNNEYCMANEIIKERLKSVLLKHKDKEILLIAHSMGTIIAYDLLYELSSEIKIKTLITIGSPLTVPFIFSKIKKDSNQSAEGKAKTPDCITKNWFNFADMNDKLAVNFKFEEKFEANKNGVVPKSAIVKNDYQSRGISNAHKSFGYLRTRQVAAIIDRFLSAPHVKFGKWIGDKFKGLFSTFKSKDK